MKFFLAICLLSFVLSVETPCDLNLNLMSGSSISISWKSVTAASSYTIDVKPAPTMSNDLTVSTDYAFIDGLMAGQEYIVRVAATVNGIVSAFSNELKVTPSGAPIIAPAPRVLSYDESSVTLSRHHMRHYRNGNDFSSVKVLVKEGTESSELEYSYTLPLKVTGLTVGKTYTFSWRFGNSKGMQETYSRESASVTLQAPSIPESPTHIHINIDDGMLKLHWRPVVSGGRPVLKYNVRVCEGSGRVLFEKVSYKPFIMFRDVKTTTGLLVQVNVLTVAGVSEWSKPYAYLPSYPAIAVQSVTVHDVVAVVHVNVTLPGSILCSYYAQNVRPAFASHDLHHSGHASVMLEGLTPQTTYTVECSLHVKGKTVSSAKNEFVTKAHSGSHLEVTDVEPFATYARISIRSDAPGAVRCMPMRKHLGMSSLHAFKKMSKRFLIKEAGDLHEMLIQDLHRGSTYRLRCMMEHEMEHALHQESQGRRLSEAGTETEFVTLSTSVEQAPKIVHVSPEAYSVVTDYTVVTVTFDMPVQQGTGQILVGDSPSSVNIPLSLHSVNGLFATFRLPVITSERLYLVIPAGAVLSVESSTDSEEYRFPQSIYWVTSSSSLTTSCTLTSLIVPRSSALLRFTCDATVILSPTCVVRAAGLDYTVNDLQVSGTALALRLRGMLQIGEEYEVQFTECGVNSHSMFHASLEVPIPTLIAVEPGRHLYAGETYQFRFIFDEAVTLQADPSDIAAMMSIDHATVKTLYATDIRVIGNVVEFEYTVNEEAKGKLLDIMLNKEVFEDDTHRLLPEHPLVSRFIETPCGPSYLIDSTADDVCRCKRTNTHCECNCGKLGASMEY